MKKRFLAVLGAGLFLLTITGMANAALTTIGTATYGGSDYNLIWDDDNNGNSVVWLDYTNGAANWLAQNGWAAGLVSDLYISTPGYAVTWDDAAWRLPSAGANPQGGYDQITSEMGDLFYNDLGLSAYSSTTAAQLNATNFDNLIAAWYWSGTECAYYPYFAWRFTMYYGDQFNDDKYHGGYGLAVRGGQVSAVPMPAAIWLFGSGIAGLAALGRCRKGNRV